MTKQLKAERIVRYIMKEYYLDVPGFPFDGKTPNEILFLNSIFEILEDFGCLNKLGLEVKAEYLSYQDPSDEA